MAAKNQDITKVLVINTGGTIGMRSNEEGVLVPAEAKCMEETMRGMPHFHHTDTESKLPPDYKGRYLVLKKTSKDQKQVIYRVHALPPLLDSSNFGPDDWKAMTKPITEEYDNVDGFVILHGTDTMANTASALSFMCENLTKPIIVTGSQIPIFETRSDGRDNLLDSLIIAGNCDIPEVLVCFNHEVLRGNRTVKVDACSFSAFKSPNMPPLVSLGVDIKVNEPAIFRPDTKKQFTIFTGMCPNVGLLRLYPGITTETVEAFLQSGIKGAVLQTYGSGNAPKNVSDLLEKKSESGMLIVNISQCIKAYVGGAYATGKALEDAGVIGGGDMTPEAALAKLAYVLGKEEWKLDAKKEMLKRSLRGEMTTDYNKIQGHTDDLN